MAQFSIKSALAFSFKSYVKHIVLLVSAAAVVGISLWSCTAAPRYVARQLGVEQILDPLPAVSVQPGQPVDQQVIAQKVQEAVSQAVIKIQAAPKHFLLLLFLTFLLVWGIYLVLLLGFKKLALHIKDSNTGSLRILLQISIRQVLRFIAASLLYGAYSIVGVACFIGLPVFFGMASRGFFGQQVVQLLSIGLGILLFITVIYWLVGYALYGYCIIDKPHLETLDALKMSRDMTRGSRGRLIVALVVMGIFIALVLGLISKISMMAGLGSFIDPKNVVGHVVSVMLTSPLWFLYLSFIYRALGGK